MAAAAPPAASMAVAANALRQRRRDAGTSTRGGVTSTRRAVAASTSQIFGAMVSWIVRPLRSMRGAVQARAPLTRGAAHAAALLAPRRAAIPVVFAIGTAALTAAAGRASCSMRPRVSAASASAATWAARFLLRTGT